MKPKPEANVHYGEGSVAYPATPIVQRVSYPGYSVLNRDFCKRCGAWVRIDSDGDGALVEYLPSGRIHECICQEEKADQGPDPQAGSDPE